MPKRLGSSRGQKGDPKPQHGSENIQNGVSKNKGSGTESSDSTSSDLSAGAFFDMKLDVATSPSQIRETSPPDDATFESLISRYSWAPTAQRLKPEQRKIIMQADIEDYDTIIDELRQGFKDQGLGTKAARLERALVPISIFVMAMTGICQAGDTFKIGQIVGGILQSLIKLLFRYTDIVDTIGKCLEDLANCLPLLRDLKDLYPSSRVKAALRDVGDNCVEFLLKVVTFLNRRSFYNFMTLPWGTLDGELHAIKEKLDRRRQDLFQEADFSFKKFVTNKLTKTEVERAPYPLKVRVMPFNENKSFFPRPSITAKVAEHLIALTQGFRAFVLHGMGGCGKTQLAMHFVYSHIDDFDVVLWIGAETQQTLAEGFLKAAAELDLPRAEGDISASLFRNLEKTDLRWLVVFDNADNPDLLYKHWPHVTNGSVLVTSRDPMYHINLAALRCEVESLDEKEGGQMLLSMLDSSGCSAATANADLAEKVALDLGGIPLAISIVAGYMLQTQMTMERFLTIFSEKDEAEKITSNATSIDKYQYHHTMATVWRISYEKLPADAFKMLCVSAFFFPDEIPETPFVMNRPKQAHGVGTTEISFGPIFGNQTSFENALSSLLRQSLLRRNPGAKRSLLSVHRKVQENVIGQISKKDQPNFIAYFEMAVKMLYHEFPRQSPLGEPIADWSTCEFYTKHVIFLLERYEQYPVLESASSAMILCTELFCDCGVYLWARGRLSDAQRLANASIKIANQVLPPFDCLRAQPYTLLGCIYLRSENCISQAGTALRMALEIRQSNISTGFGDDDEIPRHIEIQLANAFSNLGIQQKQAGNYDEAAELHLKSLSIKHKFRHDGDMDFLLAITYSNLGKVRQLQGHMEEAAKLFRGSVNTMKRLGTEMLSRKANFMCSLAEAHESLGNAEEAGYVFSGAIDILKGTVGDAPDTAYACYRFATLLYRLRHYEEALPQAEYAVAIFSNSCLISDMKLVHAHWLLSLVYKRLGNAAKSEEYEHRITERLKGRTCDKIDVGEDAWEASCALLVHD